MKPQDLYRGQAPAAMGMMGQGLNEVGANIARSTLAGYQALGQGLAGGIEKATSAVAGAYQDKKKLDAQNKADAGFVKTILPYLPEKTRTEIGSMHEDLINNPKTSALDLAGYYHELKSTLGTVIQAQESSAKVKQYEAEAAYKNAVANLKTTPAIDYSSLIPPSLGGGTSTPSVAPETNASGQDYISPFDDTYMSNEKPKIPWDQAKLSLNNYDKVINKKWWDSVPSSRQYSLLNERGGSK